MIIKSKIRVLNKRVRLPINWLAIIASKRLDNKFYLYRLRHPRVSIQRCARSFILKNHIDFDKRLYLKGTYRDELNDFLVCRLMNTLNDVDDEDLISLDPLKSLYSGDFVF